MHRVGRDERGFSLVELSVVGAVISVLVSLGFGSFVGASDKAHGRAVEVELRTALEGALVLAQEAGGRFVVEDRPIGPDDLHAAEPVFAFADVGGHDVIGVSIDDDGATIRLDEVDDSGVRHTLVAESGRGVRLCAGGEPIDCVLEEPASTTSSSSSSTTTSSSTSTSTTLTPTTVAATAPGNSGSTAAAGHRQNGR